MPTRPIRIPHITTQLAQRARDHFQPLYDVPLTEEDGREIAVNLLGAFGVLMEWKEKREARIAVGLPLPPTEPPAAPVAARRAKARTKVR